MAREWVAPERSSTTPQPTRRLGLPDQVAGDPALVGDRPVLPQVDALPHANQQAAVLDAQAQSLAGQGRADVGGHVVIALVVMGIAQPFAKAIEGAVAVLGNECIHPGRQIVQHPRVRVFVDRQAGTGVQAAQVQHAQVNAGCGNPLVELGIQPGETLAMGAYLQLMQGLLHGRRVGWAMS